MKPQSDTTPTQLRDSAARVEARAAEARADFRTNRLLWLGLAILAMGQLAISVTGIQHVEAAPRQMNGSTFRQLAAWLLSLHSDLKISVLFASLGYGLVLAGVRAHLRWVKKWV